MLFLKARIKIVGNFELIFSGKCVILFVSIKNSR